MRKISERILLHQSVSMNLIYRIYDVKDETISAKRFLMAQQEFSQNF